MNIPLAIISIMFGMIAAIPLSFWIISVYEDGLSNKWTERELANINNNINNLRNTAVNKAVTNTHTPAHKNWWNRKEDIVPPSASYFGKIAGKEEYATGALEEKYLSYIDLRDYRDQLKAKKNKNAEQNRIVAATEELIANEKTKT